MSHSITAKVLEEMDELPDHLQQQVLPFVESLRQKHLEETSGDAWDVMASLTGTIEAPATEHCVSPEETEAIGGSLRLSSAAPIYCK